MRYLIGMDLGTTNAKGALYDEKGRLVVAASGQYETCYPGEGWAQQNPEAWWSAARDIFRQIADAAGRERMKAVSGICISSQTPTLLPVDSAGRPLRDALIWMDSRAGQELSDILNTVGEERYMAVTGMRPAVSFLPPKLLWYKRHEPELFEKTACFLQVNGYINFKLTGELTMDRDQAALTQCLDAATGSWSQTISEAIGINIAGFFPEPADNSCIIGHVTEAAARETGLSAGTPVAAGSSDAIAAMYASGLTRLGEATEVSGTSSLVFAGTTALPKQDYRAGGHACALKDIPYVYNAPITATGASIKWYMDQFGLYEKQQAQESGRSEFDLLNEEALTAEPGSAGVMFFPYMMGERAPLWNDHAKGMFIGLSMHSRREDMIRAVFEGTAYALRSVLDVFKANGAGIDSLRVVGGGAKSETWLKIKASVLNLPILVLDKKTGDVPFGDALIAGLATGIYEDLTKSIHDIVTVERIIKPDPNWAAAYETRYPFFKEFYEKLDDTLVQYHKVIRNHP